MVGSGLGRCFLLSGSGSEGVELVGRDRLSSLEVRFELLEICVFWSVVDTDGAAGGGVGATATGDSLDALLILRIIRGDC